MKKTMVGYVTALINTYNKRMNSSVHSVARSCASGFVRDLNDLLEFTINVEEKEQTVPTLNNSNEELSRCKEILYKRNAEIELLKQRIKKLERNFHKKALKEVLMNLRQMDVPNSEDELIDYSIKIITEALEEERREL